MKNTTRIKFQNVGVFCCIATWNEEDEEVRGGDDWDLDVERSEEGVAVHQPAAGVEEREGEQDVLQAVDDGQVLELSPHPPPL